MAHAARYIKNDLRGLSLGTQSTLTGAISGAAAFYAKDIVADLGYDMLDYDVQRSQEAVGPELSIVGPQKGEATFKIPLRGGETSAAAAGTSPIITLGQYCGMTKHALAGGAAKVTGGSATTLTCLDADDPGWAVGDFVLCGCNAGADLQLRYITRVASAAGTTTITIAPNWTTNPVNGDTFYAVDVLIPGPGTAATYLAGYVYHGGDATDRHKATIQGCGGMFEFDECAVGQLPFATFKLMVDNWSVAEDNVAVDADGYADPFPWKSDNFYLGATAVDIHSFAFNPNMMAIPLIGQDAQGRIGWRYRQDAPAFKITPYHDNQFWTDLAAATAYRAFLQSIKGTKNAWGLCIPSVQLLKTGYGEAVGDNFMGAGLEMKATYAGENADSVQYPLYSIVCSGAAT